MASPRTRTRKQQRLTAKIRRADNLRWASLTRGQKSIEDPERLRAEDIAETMKRAYMPYLAEMLRNDLVLARLLPKDSPLAIEGKPYTYAIRTNIK